MRAVVKTGPGPGNVELVEVPDPEPGPGRVRIAVDAAHPRNSGPRYLRFARTLHQRASAITSAVPAR